MKRALIFGASGQMGFYLKEYLGSLGYQMHCPKKREIDLQTVAPWEMRSLLENEAPDEIYNLAAINNAADSWFLVDKYVHINGVGALQLVKMIKEVCPKAKFFQAGSAEVFEKASVLQAEDTNRMPENPYGLSKMMAMEAVRLYREKYGMFACTGIFFNAESPRRDKLFFAEKVAGEAARLKMEFDLGSWTKIKLGRLDARRDWGWAPEYVEVAWKMLQQETPMDFVIGTGETHTCRDFVQEALICAGLPEVEKNFDKYVEYDKTFSPVGNCMRAQPFKAKRILQWEAKYRFKDVVKMLVEAEMKALCESGLMKTTG
jgi:GDPmannose 4,6-dehydratase